jgi:molecular chaperone DnaK
MIRGQGVGAVTGEMKPTPTEGHPPSLSSARDTAPAPLAALTEMEWGSMIPGDDASDAVATPEPGAAGRGGASSAQGPAGQPSKTEAPGSPGGQQPGDGPFQTLRPTPAERPRATPTPRPVPLSDIPRTPVAFADAVEDEPELVDADMIELDSPEPEPLDTGLEVLDAPTLSDLPITDPPIPILTPPDSTPAKASKIDSSEAIRILTGFELTGEPGRPDLDEGLFYVAPPPLPSRSSSPASTPPQTAATPPVADELMHPPREISEVRNRKDLLPPEGKGTAPRPHRAPGDDAAALALALATPLALGSGEDGESEPLTAVTELRQLERSPASLPKEITSSAPSTGRSTAPRVGGSAAAHAEIFSQERARGSVAEKPASPAAFASPPSAQGSVSVRTGDFQPIDTQDLGDERSHPTLGQGGFKTKSGRFVALPDPNAETGKTSERASARPGEATAAVKPWKPSLEAELESTPALAPGEATSRRLAKITPSEASPTAPRSITGSFTPIPDPEARKAAHAQRTPPPQPAVRKPAALEGPPVAPPTKPGAPSGSLNTPVPLPGSGGSASARSEQPRAASPASGPSRPTSSPPPKSNVRTDADWNLPRVARPPRTPTIPPAPAAFVEPASPPPSSARPSPSPKAAQRSGAAAPATGKAVPARPAIEVRAPTGRSMSHPPASSAPIADLDIQVRSEGFVPAAETMGEPIRSRWRKKIPPLAAKGDVIIGIDLGTTYSCAAHVENDRAQVLASRRGTPTIPSAVCFAPGGRVVVGESALKMAATSPKTTIIGSKRLVGRPFHSPIVQEVRDHFAYDIVQGEDGEAAIMVDNRVVSLEEVSAAILSEIRESASLQIEGRVNRAVITCPAHFNERQREAVRIAGELAGFHVERILSEPTAAALNFGHGKGLSGHKVLIYDLGGGTFDVSVLEVHGEVYEVIATGGDTFLGGIDFDACITELLVEHFLETEHIDARTDPTSIARIFQYAEQAKRELSERPTTIVQIDHLVVQPYAARALTLPVRRSRVEEMWEPLVAHTIQIVKEVCERAKLEPRTIDDVILVGGQSRSPIIHKRVAEFFGKPPNRSLHPDEAIALGAAQYAASITSFDSIVLIDALPMSIGVGLPGGRYKKIIERDTRLPVERHYQLRTTRDDQDTFEILLFQGEDDRVEQNEPLGLLHVSDLPKGAKGSVSVLVTMKVTAECILELTAREMKTGKTVVSKLGTKDTPESLRAKLGLPPKPTRAEMNRHKSITNQPKGVWSWLTKLFRKRPDE